MTPQLIKPAVAKGLNELMAPIQAEFQASKEWQEITEKAYPPPPPPPKKVKKPKDKGSRHPGQKDATATAEAGDEAPAEAAGSAEVPIR